MQAIDDTTNLHITLSESNKIAVNHLDHRMVVIKFGFHLTYRLNPLALIPQIPVHHVCKSMVIDKTGVGKPG